MTTLRLRVDPLRLDTPEARRDLDAAAAILRSGGTVAFPTETVYGLGANALDAEAVKKIFAAKQRPAWDPVIVHVCDSAMLDGLGMDLSGDDSASALQERVEALQGAFWPGPLTLLLPRSLAIPDVVTAGRPLVGVRMPVHPVARELIRRAGVPIAAPSANRFAHTSPTTAQHVLDDLEGRIDAVLDGGPTACGVESTVLDPNRTPMIVYRPGAITLEQIRAVAGPAEYFAANDSVSAEPKVALPSPGVGLRHYAPNARLTLVEARDGELVQALLAALNQASGALSGERVGVMLPQDLPGGRELEAWAEEDAARRASFHWGGWRRPEELAQRLFAGLRTLDSLGCSAIVCPVPAEGGIGDAIRDRLRKAAKPT